MERKVEVIVGKTAGFCYGVDNAVTKTMQILDEEKNSTVYCLGELVHNQQVVKRLEGSGLNVIETVEELEENTGDVVERKAKVIIRAHGIPPVICEKLKEKNCEIIDLTCPNVLAIHKISENFSNDGFYIFLIGKKKHPEVIGTYGFCKEASIIEGEDDIDEAFSNLEKSKRTKVLIIAQTTFSLAKFNELTEIIKQRLAEIKWPEKNIVVKNTICDATRLRQDETEKISRQVDYMIIIGGKNSSNTKKLYEIAKINCKNTVCIETANELLIDDMKNEADTREKFRIGIMAGASTPKESIEEVKKIVDML